MATIRDHRKPERGLRPVQDVVGRIRFDSAFDPKRFTIGYEERFAGVREAPLSDFIGEGEIPWHRIWFIKAGPLVVWDRRERIDLVFGSGASPAPDLAAIQRACTPLVPEAPPPAARRRSSGAAEFTPIPCLRFDPARGAWSPVAGPLPELAPESLAVVTYNILYDTYEAEHIYTAERRLACRALVEAHDADIIALQEVTPEFWTELLAEAWVRERYHVSAGPDAHGLRPYGQALLSRWPLALELHHFSPHKKLLLGQLTLAGRPLTIAAVHLTSNQKDGAADKRAEQFAVLAARLAQRPGDALVLGDFNFGDGDENHQLAAAGLRDVWQQLHPHHPGFTFDPVANPLAALMSRTGAAARYDRVLLRAETAALAPIDVLRFGDRPIGERLGQSMFASDHFGLCALLQVAAASPTAATLDAAPVHRSALVVLPPERVWAPIQAIRAVHDPAYARWMPHINLIYGFVPEALFPQAAALIEPLLRGHPPIHLRFAELRRFDHRGSTTVWLAPEPPDALVALQRRLAALFPGCVEQAVRAGFTPHLTVAKLTGSPAEIASTIAQWQAQWRPLECTVSALHLISRGDDDPFAIRHTLSFGTALAAAPAPARPRGDLSSGTAPAAAPAPDRKNMSTGTGTATPPALAIPGVVPPPPWLAVPSPRHHAAITAIAGACGDFLAAAPCLHIVGSARLGVATPDSDLDLVCAGPRTVHRADLFAAVHAALADRITAIRETTSAGLPVLRMRLGELAVDLQYAALPDPIPAARLASLTPEEFAGLDEPSRRAALTCLDADALIHHIAARPGVPAFVAMLQRVRGWARARALDVGAWGLLGGYTWALLAAHAARDAARTNLSDPDALVRHFFATYAVWEPGRPVALGPLPDIAPTRRAPWPNYTPSPPAFNSARGQTRSTPALIRGELRRADELVRAGDPELAAPVDPASDPRRLVLALSGVDPDAELACRGWLDGHILSLLLALENAHARVRPYPRPTAGPDGLQQAIGLVGGQARELLAAAHDFTLEFSMWPERPVGATLHADLVTT